MRISGRLMTRKMGITLRKGNYSMFNPTKGLRQEKEEPLKQRGRPKRSACPTAFNSKIKPELETVGAAKKS